MSKSIRYSGVRFHIFYCNSAGLSDVVRYDGVFVIAGLHSCITILPREQKNYIDMPKNRCIETPDITDGMAVKLPKNVVISG